MKVIFLPIIADFLQKELFGVVYFSATFDELVNTMLEDVHCSEKENNINSALGECNDSIQLRKIQTAYSLECLLNLIT